MAKTHHKALFAAVFKVLRPLARFLLRNGVTYAAFKDLAKQAFVDVATHDFALPGKKQTASRVATLTGLSRKEIKRVLEISYDEDRDLVTRYNRAARVVYGWVHDPSFNDGGSDTALPVDGGSRSFSQLVKIYSGDVPPRAILDELIQVGVVRMDDDDDQVHLLEPAYIPAKGTSEMMALFGRDVAGLIHTMDKNIHRVGKPVFQRKVFYDNMPEEAADTLKVLLAERGQVFLQLLDQWMAEHDRDVNPDVSGKGRKAAGVGLYYFEEDVSKES